jgi:hypothetical protein
MTTPKLGEIYADANGFEFQVVPAERKSFATVIDEKGGKEYFETEEEFEKWKATVKLIGQAR